MSIKWMYEELVETKLDGAALLLVLDLALHADEGGICHTSEVRLADYTGLKPKYLYKMLRALHSLGYITVKSGKSVVLEIRVNCMHMLVGDPAVDGSPVLTKDNSGDTTSLSHLTEPHSAPNWN